MENCAKDGPPARVGLIKNESLEVFGKALHTATDKTSPAHTDPSGNPREWHPSEYEEHNKQEQTITPEQMKEAVSAAREAFRDTYGSELADQAAQQPDDSPPPQSTKEEEPLEERTEEP